VAALIDLDAVVMSVVSVMPEEPRHPERRPRNSSNKTLSDRKPCRGDRSRIRITALRTLK